MINLNNTVLRNLEEQVQYLTEQLNAFKNKNMTGFNIVGNVNSIEDLPEEYTGNYGDCYLVVNDSPNPNDLYFYGDIGDGQLGWIYLGPFPLQGPQGAAGQRGLTGATGQSTSWSAGSVFTNPAKEGDMFLYTPTYDVYMYNNGQWRLQCNIKGLPGTDGLNGNSITSITAVHSDAQSRTTVTITTDKGGSKTFYVPDGQPGVGFHIAHIYPEDDADIPATLPADIVDTLEELYPAEEASPSEAILVKTSTEGDFLFVILTTEGVQTWDEAGQIESVQGPAGEPGTQITSNEQIQVHPIDDYHNDLNILSLPYLTTAPNSAYTPIGNSLKLVVLDAEPATYYDGYYYIITEE